MKTINRYMQQNNGNTVLLCGNSPVLLSTIDYPLISQYQWSIGSHGYVTCGAGEKQILMHRLICNAPENLEVDHINHNRHDNRRENLRLCTSAQNSYNKTVLKKNKSGFKGVCTVRGKWQAQIVFKKKAIYLGLYDDIIDAANAYDSAAFLLVGEFAWRNFPELPIQTDIFERLSAIRSKGRMDSAERQQVKQLYAEGKSIADIAAIMHRSESSIRRYVSGRTFNGR